MIDFRYHIVSLISVFLALAIGIVLGAGPLKDAIGDQLTGQVEELRTGKEELRVALTETEANLNQRDEFLEGISSSVLTGTLPGRRIAIVALEDSPEDLLEDVTEHLASAGASVTETVQLDASWSSDSKATFRQSLASSLTDYLDPPTPDESTDADLATALVQALTAVDPQDESKSSAAASDIRSLLAASDLVSFDNKSAPPADMIVFVSNPPETDEEDPEQAEAELRARTVQLQTLLASVAAEHTEASVVVSASDAANDLLIQIRETADYADQISTVAGVDEQPGQLNIPLVLAARAMGTVGQYGAQDDATAAVPAVTHLDAVDRTPRMATVPESEELPPSDAEQDGEAEPEDEAADADESTDGPDGESEDEAA